MTEIYLIRHCEAVPDKLLPESEWPLSAEGVLQATALVDELGGTGIQAVYSSPYVRAVDTAKPLASLLGCEIGFESDLRERKLSGELIDDWLQQLEQTWIDFDYKLEGGESSRECQKRVVAVLRKLAKANAGEKIALSSHGNAIALFLNSVDQDFAFDQWRQMKNPDVFHVIYEDGEFSMGSVSKRGCRNAVVLENYEICYPDPLILQVGETVEVLREETKPEWKGYFYCRDSQGKEGWISDSYLNREGQMATLKTAYNATELNAMKGEEVRVLHEDNGWCWCRNKHHSEGWLPQEILKSEA